ncbi:SLC25A38 [Lepeophtheirus salmonis]|uniref:SLC25A38 n=1 Tax=Lepeophtheirus salmonis TaxID=72036 RepID=A0A7R8CQZ4_LEPSM|nr:SLC25A38 [Lepeophtheirus salmonis]CAF2900023.1 SLC25A38 [Lepeophtheirus salmonis]
MKEGANSSKKGAVLRSFIAGSFSASVSTVLFQPLDLIKTRMIQRTVVFDGATMVTVTREVLSSDAKILGLWKGIAPSLLRTVPGVGIHFSSLTFLDKIGLKGKDTLSSLICGMMARSTAALITIPLTVVKVRKEGYRGMSSGLIPTILRDAPFSGIYLAFYSTLKQKAQCSTLPDHDAAWIHFLCGLIAGMGCFCCNSSC